MNATETTQLLTLIAAAEGRPEVNPAMAISWAFALDDIPFDVGQSALKDAFHAGEFGRINPQSIRRHAAPHLRRLARNVRSAKLRHLVPDEWPENRPLPPAAIERLKAEYEATNDRPDELDGGSSSEAIES